MSEIDELLSRLPLSKIASQLGVDEATAEQATRTAVPALVKGMQANAQDDERARALARAIADHARAASSGAAPRPESIEQVDTDDGAKIVHHVFGDNEEAVVNRLGGMAGGSDMIKKLLPMLAPIVMGFLAKQFTGKQGDAKGAADIGPDAGESGGGGGLGDLLEGPLGGLLGGGGGGEGGAGGGGLGDLLGGLLGGGGDRGDDGGGGGLGDLLGGLLGGGSR
jgi:hypothetical protein